MRVPTARIAASSLRLVESNKTLSHPKMCQNILTRSLSLSLPLSPPPPPLFLLTDPYYMIPH